MVRAWSKFIAAFASLPFCALVTAQTFSSNTPITIRDGTSALPFPSTINVSGVSGPIGSISVTLVNMSHTYSADLVIGVKSPSGTIYPLINRCGGSTDLLGTYTFVPAGLAQPFDAIRFLSSARDCAPPLSLGVPGPIGELGDVLGTANVNGTWSLFVRDVVTTDQGAISGGWSISFGPPGDVPAPTADSITYQGRLVGDDGPVNSQVLAEFRLFNAETAGTRTGVPLMMYVTPHDGIFSVPLDFGNQVQFDAANPLWLEVTIDGVPMSPRQRLQAAPYAKHAGAAAFATAAGTASSATIATTAQNAAHASVADSSNAVAWGNISGVPANVANLRWSPASLPDSQTISGAVGINAEPLGSSRLLIHQPAVNATQWHIELTNAVSPSFRGGIRLSDAGFLETSNLATSQFAFFARLSSTGAWTAVSDARLKTDVRDADGLLDAAMKLRPVYFHWLHDADPARAEDFGLIAQEVRGVLPRLVTGEESKETLTVNYSQLSVVAIGAIQELKRQHDAEMAAMAALLDARAQSQQEQIDALKASNEDLLRRIERIESRDHE